MKNEYRGIGGMLLLLVCLAVGIVFLIFTYGSSVNEVQEAIQKGNAVIAAGAACTAGIAAYIIHHWKK